MMIGGQHVVLAMWTILLLVSSSPRADAGECREASQLVQVAPQQSARLRELTCRLDSDPSASLRVRFQRLHESAAGVLLNNGKAPWTSNLYGKVTVLENPVLKEYRTLVRKFATKVRYDRPAGEGAGVGFKVIGLDQPEPGAAAISRRTDVVETFELPLSMEGPLIDDILHILKQPTWPPNLQLEYSGEDLEPGQATVFDRLQGWRYLTQDDLDRMEERIKRYNSLLRKGSREWSDYRIKRIPSALALLRHLTAGGLPERFRHFSSFVSGDGCFAMNFSLNGIRFDVDVAMLHNPSTKPLTIGRLVGAEGKMTALRPLRGDSEAPSVRQALTATAVTIQPGETLIVPLQMIFGPDEGFSEDASEAQQKNENAERRYQRIQSSKPNTEFRLSIETVLQIDQQRGRKPDTYIIRKKRESFTPHAKPEEKPYAFGPEWSLIGIEVGREQLSFVKPARDGIRFTVAGGAGSCPILYAWSEPDQRWVRHGKILHTALTRAKQQIETISFAGWVPRFLISEEELEVARLEDVRAAILLDDGTLRWLIPKIAGKPTTGQGETISLYSGDEAEFRLTLPANVDASKVEETRLMVKGYYDRYSAILTSQMSRRHTGIR
jgi:hypothetical protein